jgi:hypothetical protein
MLSHLFLLGVSQFPIPRLPALIRARPAVAPLWGECHAALNAASLPLERAA